MTRLSIRKQLFLKLFTSILLLVIMVFVIILLISNLLKQERKDYELLSKEEALILVDENHPLPDNYYTKLLTYDHELISEKMKLNLDKMMKESCHQLVCLFLKEGYIDDAEMFSSILKEESVGLQMEHKSGLAVDFYQENQEKKNQKMWNWLQENADRYGFILEDASAPWHYRFVGIEHAKKMKEKNLTLEDYLKEKEGI